MINLNYRSINKLRVLDMIITRPYL